MLTLDAFQSVVGKLPPIHIYDQDEQEAVELLYPEEIVDPEGALPLFVRQAGAFYDALYRNSRYQPQFAWAAEPSDEGMVGLRAVQVREPVLVDWFVLLGTIQQIAEKQWFNRLFNGVIDPADFVEGHQTVTAENLLKLYWKMPADISSEPTVKAADTEPSEPDETAAQGDSLSDNAATPNTGPSNETPGN